MSTKLALSTLPQIADSVKVPTYRRDDLAPGIVHFGVGNFFRAHQAYYLDALFNTGKGLDWAIMGAGVMAADSRMGDTLAAQDFLTTVVEQTAESRSARVIGSLIGFLPPGDTEKTVLQLAHPSTRIVSLTVTEGGYFIDPASGRFNPEHPDIRHDAADPTQPRTVFGLILAGLKSRRTAGITPYTVMSCDNIPGNGRVTRDAVVGLAELSDPDLATWIRSSVAFPNSMVDRITPATTERERAIVREDFGIDDAAPVFCEDYKQWVLEDRFSAGRPDLERVGVTFVDDVEPYEHMKIRMLNGGHAIIAYPSALLDIEFAHQAMANPLINAYLAKVEREEIIPIIPPVPRTDLVQYFQLIEQRFSNPSIGDTIARLCQDGSNRQPKFILPSIGDRLAAGLSINGLCLETALWCRYLEGVSDRGTAITISDENAGRLQQAAIDSRTEPTAFLSLQDIFGTLAESESYQIGFSKALASLRAKGVEQTLNNYLTD